MTKKRVKSAVLIDAPVLEALGFLARQPLEREISYKVLDSEERDLLPATMRLVDLGFVNARNGGKENIFYRINEHGRQYAEAVLEYTVGLANKGQCKFTFTKEDPRYFVKKVVTTIKPARVRATL